MRVLRLAGLCVFLALFISGAAFGGEFYSFVGNKLATIDIATGIATPFPYNTGVGQPPGLDFQPGTGVLFGSNGGYLKTFDTGTGVGSYGPALWYNYDGGIPKPAGFVSLAFAPNGVLYGAINGNSWLYRIEPDGEVVPLALLSKSLSTSGMDLPQTALCSSLTAGPTQPSIPSTWHLVS